MNMKKNNLYGRTSLVALSVMMGAAAPQVMAQDDDKFSGLEEIVITASKREETLQEAGLSVTTLSALNIERMGIDSFVDFAVRVPNLGFGNESDGRFNANSPAIRGVFGANTTGFYIDDMPVPMSMQPRVMDVARVEVLRGPQGSLYGARSMGGTIRMITKQPDFEGFSGTAHATLSSVKEGDENWSVDTSFNMPVIDDKLAVRVTAYYGQNSGVFDRVYDPTWTDFTTGEEETNPGPAFDKQKNVDDEKYGGFQIIATAKLSDALTFTPKFMYQKVKADGLPFADNNVSNFTEERFFDTDEPGSDRWYIASGTFNWDLESGSITSSTSYFDRYIDEREEEHTFLNFLYSAVIGIPIAPIVSPIDENEAYNSIVHETRYTSAFDGPLQFTAGVFYQKSKNHLQYDPASYMHGMEEAVGFPINGGTDLIFTTDNHFNVEEYAGFGELTYDVSEQFSITAGGRWYKTKTEADIDSDGFANGGFTHIDGKQEESGFNPKVLVQYHANDDMDFYASASKGYRIGGVNGNLSDTLCGDELAGLGVNKSDTKIYNSDSIWSYEGGMKSKFADNRVSLNLAGYLIKWSDIAQQNRLACGFQYIANAGKAEIKGFELELIAAPVEGLTMTFAAGYANAEITDAGGVAGVATGDKIQGVPDWTVAASSEYVFPINNDMEGIMRADFNYYGKSFSSNNEAANPRLRKAWNALNLRAGVIKDNWEITLFVDNATNEHANLADSRSIAAETPGRQRLVTNRPRTIGLDFRTRF